MKIYAYGSKGAGKTIGEDSIMAGNGILSEGYLETEAGEKNVIAICDGVGGNNAGDEASMLALKGIREARFLKGVDEQYIANSIQKINNDILDISGSHEKFFGMATTMTGLYTDNERSIMFHIGNCRLYVANGAYLRQISEDHTNVSKWVRLGVMTRAEAENHPEKNVIYACLGGGKPEYCAPLTVTDISKNIGTDRDILLTSDGIHDYVDQDSLEKIMLSEKPVRERFLELTELARKNGSTDDASVVFFDRGMQRD